MILYDQSFNGVHVSIRGKGSEDHFENETTESTSQKETEATQTDGSSAPTSEETTAPVLPPVMPDVTFPNEDDFTQEAVPETTAPDDFWTGGGIVLPDDDWE